MFADVKNLKLNKKNYVVFDNKFAFANQVLSKWAAILLRIVISNIIPSDEKFYTFCFSVSELAEFLDLSRSNKSNFYHYSHEICCELSNFKVCIDNKMINVFCIAEYRNHLFYIKLSDQMESYFLNLERHYIQYPLELVFLLKNSYSLRLFEIIWAKDGLYRHENIDLEFSVSELRRALGCEKKYEDFNNFKKKVLIPSLNIITKSTDLNCFINNYRYDKNHRKIEFLKIEIHKKPSTTEQILL